MKNTIKKYYESSQKNHDNMVQIFQRRANEASLIIDEDPDGRNESMNRNKSSFIEHSAIAGSPQLLQPMQSNSELKIEQLHSQKRNKQPFQSLDNQIKDTYEQTMLSPSLNPDGYSLAFQSGQELRESFQNDNKTFSFMKRNNDDENTYINENNNHQNKLEAYFNESSNMNLSRRKNQSLNLKEHVTSNSNQSNSLNHKNEQDTKNVMRETSSMDDGLGFGRLDKQKVTSATANHENVGNSNEQLPSNLNNGGDKRRAILFQTYKRGALDSASQRKKSHQQTMVRNKKDDKRQSEIDKSFHMKKEKKANFLGVIMKMKNYAYKMASTVESKRLAILTRQKFEYLTDKTVVFGNWERDYSQSNDYHPIQKLIYHLFNSIQSTNCMKRFRETLPVIPLFLPQSNWKFFWDILNMIIVIIFFFFLPLHFIYDIKFSTIFYFQTLDIGLTVIGTIDIIINLNTAKFQKGNLLRKRTLIFLEYFSRDGFISTIFIILVWIIVISERVQFDVGSNYKFGVFCFLVVLLKIIEQSTFQSKINDRFYLKKTMHGIIRLMQIFFNLFIVCHVFACTWLVIGKYDQTEATILCAQQNSSDCSYSWLDRLKGIEDMSYYEEYLRAYYFTTVTMITVGYGDITPANSREYLLSVLTMLIACGMFGYSLNSIGNILAEMNRDYKSYNEHFNAINGYMHKKNISLDLQFQVREYLQYFFLQSNQEDLQKQQKVIRLLPEALQNQIMIEANKIVLDISPLFKSNFSEQILQKTIKIIEQKKYRPGELIIREGVEDSCSIFFIEKGSVEIFNQHSNEELKILHKGQSFGEVSFFTGQKRSISIRSIEFTTILEIKRNLFFELVKNSPLDLERFCMIKDSILFNNRYESIGINCYCCKSTNHTITDCNFIHVHLDKYKVIKEYVKDDQIREKIQRGNSIQNALENRSEVEQCAIQFVDENFEELQQEGWFIDLLRQEYQGVLTHSKSNQSANQKYINLRTTSLNEHSLRNQTPRVNQNFQDKIIQNNNGLANIKIQYGKSISGNIVQQDYYDSHSNMISDYTPASTQNMQLQKGANNAFRRHSVKSEENQNSLAFNISKKVQFSVSSLPANETDDHYQGDKSGGQHSPPQQYINLNSHVHSQNYQYQISGGDFSNTPTNRLRQLSNNSERPSSINVVSSNNHISFNQPNYQSQNSAQNNSNYQGQYSNSIQVNSLNTQVNTQANTNQQIAFQRGFLTQQISNQSFQDFHSLQQNQTNTPTHSQLKSNNNAQQIIALQQRQKESAVVQRGSKKRITLKTDIIVKKRPQTATYITKQISNLHERQTNEGLIRQLQELMQLPNINTVKDNTPFETLKNFTVYMPHNNHDRAILSYIGFMRKKTILKKSKKSGQKEFESTVQRNGTEASSRRNGTEALSKNNTVKQSIQQYKQLLSENIIDNEISDQARQEILSHNHLNSQTNNYNKSEN